MKLAIFAFTVYFMVSSGNCGLVKDFFGTVHQEVHTIVDKTVNAIGKVTHKVHEPFGVFLHRNKGPNKNIPDTGKREELSTTTSKTEPHVVQDNENNAEHHNANAPSDTKIDSTYTSNGSNRDKLTASIVEQTSVKNVNNNNTDTLQDNGINEIEPEKVSNGNKDTLTTSTTTEYVIDNNDIRLENILPVALHNDTHFKEVDLYAINAVRGSFSDTGNNNNTKDLSNGDTWAKPNGGPSNKAEREQNLISDQMVFPDSKDNLKKKVKECPKGLVKSVDGNCREEVDLEKKTFKGVSSVFEAGCPVGTRRALDGSCQTNIGWSK